MIDTKKSEYKDYHEKKTDVTFLNPYNFIPLPHKIKRTASVEKGSLTGVIECTLVPITDFFIPNTSAECTANSPHGNTVRDFFSYNQLVSGYNISEHDGPEKPVIPGSELRGMIRSMYEAFTNSCLSCMDTDKPLSSRSSDAKQPGLLEYINGKWVIFQAGKHKVSHDLFKKHTDSSKTNYIEYHGKKYYNGDKVNFNSHIHESYNQKIKKTIKSSIADDISDYGRKSGYLVIGGEIGNKKNEFIFVKEKKTDISDIVISNAINGYNSSLKDFYQNEKVNRSGKSLHTGKEITPAAGAVYPVWYEQIGDKLYLSPACIGRNVYNNTLDSLAGKHKCCESKEDICEACALFGLLGEKSGRLRFSDAVFSSEDAPLYQEVVTLKELSSPKITSMEMYTHSRISPEFWTYDYYKENKRKIYFKNDELELNGRKFYYHHPECKGKNYYKYVCQQSNEQNNDYERLVTVRPLKGDEKNTFRFRVFFEHITETELEKLLCVISLWGNDSEHYYKLGMGKPIGLGSVKVRVNDVKLRSICPDYDKIYDFSSTKKYEEYYSGCNDETIKKLFETDNAVFDQLKNMTDFRYAEKLKSHGKINDCISSVHYPTAFDGPEGFKWFTNNRKIGGKYEQVLGTDGVLKKNSAPKKKNFKKR